jgi:hypothetical protein
VASHLSLNEVVYPKMLEGLQPLKLRSAVERREPWRFSQREYCGHEAEARAIKEYRGKAERVALFKAKRLSHGLRIREKPPADCALSSVAVNPLQFAWDSGSEFHSSKMSELTAVKKTQIYTG